MTKQDQKVDGGGEGYQAGNNLVVQKGITTAQMAEIITAITVQLQQYTAQADAIFSSRCNDLRDSLVNEFSKQGTKGNSDSFVDPDYQFALHSAHESYGRKGGDELKAELVKLLVERSVKPTGSRSAMILNEAIRIAGNLTREEYAALALIFAFRYVAFGSNSPGELLKKIDNLIEQFVGDLSMDNYSYSYLSSMSCASVNVISEVNLWDAILNRYRSRFSNGFTSLEYDKAVSSMEDAKLLSGLLKKLPNHFSERFSFVADERTVLEGTLKSAGVSDETGKALLALWDQTSPSDEDVRKYFNDQAPNFARLEKVWNGTEMKSTELTALGKTLAHSTLVSKIGFSTSLDVWVQ